jgi:phosphate transport system substrate-binding protein
MNQTMGKISVLSLLWLLISLVATGPSPAHEEVRGRIVVAGYGPELPVVQDLGRAFEKSHPGTAIDFQWERTVKAVELVKSGEAQIAITDQPDPALQTTALAWDGIAVIVNFTNPVAALSADQVKALFTGKITRWSDLDGADQPVEALSRATEDNVRSGFETSLGIAGGLEITAKPIRTDEKILRAVSGRDRAISYLSLAAALKAQEDGVSIRVLTIDQVEPGQPSVRSGAYTLRRPVLALTSRQPDPLTQAFLRFALSGEGQPILQPVFVPGPAASFEWQAPPGQVTDRPAQTHQKQKS